eukprot:12333074-Alexandrium_andersonii.AAC.1
MLLVRLFFQSGGWPPLKVAEYRRLHASMMHVLRRTHPAKFDERVSDADVLRELQMPTVGVMLWKTRLTFLARVVRLAKPALSSLLEHEARMPDSWMGQTLKDLELFRERDHRLD